MCWAIKSAIGVNYWNNEQSPCDGLFALADMRNGSRFAIYFHPVMANSPYYIDEKNVPEIMAQDISQVLEPAH